MARFKQIPQKVNEGKIIYGDRIVDGIVLLAVDELEYVELSSVKRNKTMSSNAIKVVFEKDGVHVDVAVKIYYTQSISETAFKIQEAIRHNVEAMTEYHIAAVNVLVDGVLFEEPVKGLQSGRSLPSIEEIKEQRPVKRTAKTATKSVSSEKSTASKKSDTKDVSDKPTKKTTAKKVTE